MMQNVTHTQYIKVVAWWRIMALRRFSSPFVFIAALFPGTSIVATNGSALTSWTLSLRLLLHLPESFGIVIHFDQLRLVPWSPSGPLSRCCQCNSAVQCPGQEMNSCTPYHIPFHIPYHISYPPHLSVTLKQHVLVET